MKPTPEAILALQKTGQLEVFPGRHDNNWYWHLKGRNGEIIAASEGYTRYDSAVEGAFTALEEAWRLWKHLHKLAKPVKPPKKK